MRKTFLDAIDDAIGAIHALREERALLFMEELTSSIIDCYRQGGKLLIAGNGGSLCDAMHFAEELTGFYREKRAALAAIALSDPGHLTCVANDIGYERVFARSIEALGKEGDLFIALTTSGNSMNLIAAAKEARSRGLTVVGFLGKDGGALKSLCDLFWIVNGFGYSDRIQEAHMAAIHMIIQAVEEGLFYSNTAEREPDALHYSHD